MAMTIAFVVPVCRPDVLKANFMMSPAVHRSDSHQVILQEGFSSAAVAFNDAIDRAEHDYLVFCHEDVYFPENWLEDLQRAVNTLDRTDPRWGVLGCAGRTRDNVHRGYVFSNGLGVLGNAFEAPLPVQTLDELVLVLRKSSGLRFDERLPHFHFYGADICLQAVDRGLTPYAINAFCIHNTQQITALPREFYECARYVRRKWRAHVPIQTTCIRLTRTNLPLLRMLAHDFCSRHLAKPEGRARRPKLDELLTELAPVLACGADASRCSSV